MPKKYSPLYAADKNIAEALFGHQPGRPTISLRAGRVIADALGTNEEAGTALFHTALLAAGTWTIALAMASANKPPPTAPRPTHPWLQGRR